MIGPGSEIGDASLIDSGTKVAESCKIGKNVSIGKDCVIDRRAVIADGVVIPNFTRVRAKRVINSSEDVLVMAPVIAESEVTLSELEKDKGYIICIDDEASVIYTLKEQLSESFGSTYEILGCESGEEALELIETLENEEKIIEMVITDQIMPGIKGDELLKIIHQRLPDTIKVMLTGHAGLQSAIKAGQRRWNKSLF